MMNGRKSDGQSGKEWMMGMSDEWIGGGQGGRWVWMRRWVSGMDDGLIGDEWSVMRIQVIETGNWWVRSDGLVSNK